MLLTGYHAKYFAHAPTERCAPDSIEKLAGAVASAQVDLNSDQADAALFRSNPECKPIEFDRFRSLAGFSPFLPSLEAVTKMKACIPPLDEEEMGVSQGVVLLHSKTENSDYTCINNKLLVHEPTVTDLAKNETLDHLGGSCP